MTPNNKKGFTLVEILVVLLLVTLMLTVIAPLFAPGMRSVETKGAAQELVAGLRYARGQAILKGEEAVLALDVERHRYRVNGKEGEFTLPERLSLKLETAKSEQVSEHRGSIRFFPDGSSTGGRITISDGNHEQVVDVNWINGQVSIDD